jgi:hypothetical protein
MYNKNLFWFKDPEFLEVWRRCAGPDAAVHDRKYTLYYLAKATRSVAGDSAECGVYQGASSRIILDANSGLAKRHHMFDSFEGLSEPDDDLDSPNDERVFRWQKYDLAVPERALRERFIDYDDVKIWKGWIPERFDEVEDRNFSLVHIDVDLYQPTFESMSFFYPRINPGGLIVCDDYGFTSCPGASKAVDEFLKDKPEVMVSLTTGQGFMIKQ